MLFCGPEGCAWYDIVQKVARELGLALEAYCIGPDSDLRDPEGCRLAASGTTSSGAILARPDGFVGWRAERLEEMAQHTLEEALKQILSRILRKVVPVNDPWL